MPKSKRNPNQPQLNFERKNQDMVRLPQYAQITTRPIPHPPIASPYAGASIPKIVYISTTTPFMAAVKRVQKLLRQAEKRATASVDLANSKKRDHQKLAAIARGEDELRRREEVFVKATGRAIAKAVSVGKWFEEQREGGEYAVRVKTGTVLVVDDVEVDEEARRRVLEGGQVDEQVGKKKKGDNPEESSTVMDGDASTSLLLSAGTLSSSTSASTAAPACNTQPLPPLSRSALKKRKRAAAMAESDLPETRTRWVNTVEIAVTFK